MLLKSHLTKQVCPRCDATLLRHVHCPNVACDYFLLVCVACDKLQAVQAVMDDHTKDCCGVPPARFVRAA